jgi:ABC-2 type transport system ATP-binding protein
VAVDNVNLNIQKGEILGLLGINGAGKTTMLKMICGLLNPTRGEIKISGLPLERNRSKLLNDISAVLEGSRNSLWPMTVKQNLIYFGYLKNTRGRILMERGQELLNFFQLNHKKNEVVKNLSKGMKQKLAIVLAFISDPELILLDEPTLGLDVQTSKLVKQRIVQLARENQKTVLLTSHQIGMVEEICDRVAIISKGKIIACERTEKFLQNMGREQYVFKLQERPDLSILNHIPEVKDLELISDNNDDHFFSIRMIIDRKDNLFPILEALQKSSAKILSIAKSEPNLEDVFVRMIE